MTEDKDLIIEDSLIIEEKTIQKQKKENKTTKIYKVISIKPTFTVLISDENEIKTIECYNGKYSMNERVEL